MNKTAERLSYYIETAATGNKDQVVKQLVDISLEKQRITREEVALSLVDQNTNPRLRGFFIEMITSPESNSEQKTSNTPHDCLILLSNYLEEYNTDLDETLEQRHIDDISRISSTITRENIFDMLNEISSIKNKNQYQLQAQGFLLSKIISIFDKSSPNNFS
ncbi:MAG TPA: hypothetical protein PK370_02925 [Candidatus Woesebacteria bacterium]|nr:hypothetical protein [Candidatus Woesebacteria bacterium]HPJ17260.1 hypothetical protein [Candidatus Woesebacteria bacterium]